MRSALQHLSHSSSAGNVHYGHPVKSWWPFAKPRVHEHHEQANTVRTLADTPENRAKALQDAAKDGAQSVVARHGRDILILSGGTISTRGPSALSGFGGIDKGMTLTIDGKQATVLHTDNGFAEIDASKVVVAVVDTGVDANHPALKGRVLPGYNAITGGTDVSDHQGHGTHVAGIIGASAEGRMSGVAPNVRILPIKALGASSEPNRAIARGIRYAADNGAHVINMSFFVRKGDPGYDDVIAALDYASKKGVVLVKSAGNTGKNGLTSPAEHPAVITVGALKLNNPKDARSKSSFSSYGDRLDITAPGDKVLSLKPGGGYTSMSGTSMAAPHVAGLAALLRAKHPDWSPEQVRQHLSRTADDLGAPGKDSYFGNGAVNPFKAVFAG